MLPLWQFIFKDIVKLGAFLKQQTRNGYSNRQYSFFQDLTLDEWKQKIQKKCLEYLIIKNQAGFMGIEEACFII